MAREKNLDKQRAVAEGRKWYVGSSCKHCGGVIRNIQGVCQYCDKYGRLASMRSESKKKDYNTKEGRDKQRNRRYLRDFGISLNEYEAMLTEQKGLCLICKGEDTTGKRLAVDHCHETGKVRGLLCNHCNTGLGKFKDDPKLLEAAVLYLNERSSVNAQEEK
ncbi:recombination endonuclease VII [Synechococcus phage S-CREM2]|nr:recombination endonuclease VII [Synechococcus phage S-CREM2]